MNASGFAHTTLTITLFQAPYSDLNEPARKIPRVATITSTDRRGWRPRQSKVVPA